MPLRDYQYASASGESRGIGLTAIGGPAFVVNTNTKKLNVPTDGVGRPWQIDRAPDDTVNAHLAAYAPNHQFVRPFLISSMGMYLNLWHIWRSNVVGVQAPRVQVYGLLPAPQMSAQPANNPARFFPRDADDQFPLLGQVLTPNKHDMWVLLEDLSSETAYFELGASPVCAWEDSMWISRRKAVYLQGCVRGMVLITQVASYELIAGESATSSGAGSDQTEGMILGQLSG